MRMSGEILMAGSIPLKSAEEVFRACGQYVGPYVFCLPDGEFGPRAAWIGYLSDHVFHGNRNIETVQKLDSSRPTSIGNSSNRWMFRVKRGVQAVHLKTGYAEIALESYATFTRLRDAGEIPTSVRFQVCFPGTGSAIIAYFQDPTDWPVMFTAYEDAIRSDIEEILAHVPADDLVIQLDICNEVRDILDAYPWSPPRETKFDETITGVSQLSSFVPDAVLLGLHWCYGTLGGWPMTRPENLELCKQLTNAAVSAIERRVDFVHMPVLRLADDSYFEALRDLDCEDTKVFLGLIHHTDGVEGFRERLTIAERHLQGDFGVSSVCGYGRLSEEETHTALEVHQAVGDMLRAERSV